MHPTKYQQILLTVYLNEGFQKLKKMQGKKISISAFYNMDYDMISYGIRTENLVLVKEIIDYVKFFFRSYTNNMKLINLINTKNYIDDNKINNKFLEFQNEIKRSKKIKNKFRHIIDYLNFNECETFSDQTLVIYH